MQNSWPRHDVDASGDPCAPGAGVSAVRVLETLAGQIGLRLWILVLPDGETTAIQVVDGARTPVPDDVVEWARTLSIAALADGGDGPVAVPDIGADERLAHLATLDHLVVGSLVAAEVATGEARPGVLAGLDPEARQESSATMLPLVELMAHLLGALRDLQRESDRAQHEAATAREQGQRDGLTGLFNREGWDAAIRREAERCANSGQGASIVIIDLDDLKDLNDRYGHSFGDERLSTLATVIADTARADDVVARLGGDEFGLLAPGSPPGTGESLTARLSEQFERHGLSASVGSAECPPGGNLLETWRRADLEMYAAKRIRRSPARRSTRDTSRSAVRRDAPSASLSEEVCEVVGAMATIATTPWRIALRVVRR